VTTKDAGAPGRSPLERVPNLEEVEMSRTLIGLLIIAHGLVIIAMWAPTYSVAPRGTRQPPNPAHSWILGDVRAFSLFFGIIVGLALAVAGIGYLGDLAWWPEVAVVAGVASLFLFAIFFTPWWAAGIAISIGLIIGAVST
jgi:hypothetical protein